MTGNKGKIIVYWLGIKVADSWTYFPVCAAVLFAVSPYLVTDLIKTKIPEN